MGFPIEKGVTRGRFGEHVIELGNVGDDRLLVWFGGINICKEKKGMRLVFESVKYTTRSLIESECLFIGQKYAKSVASFRRSER